MEQVHVTGMTCAACCASVEKAVSAVPGVTEKQINSHKKHLAKRALMLYNKTDYR